ncbi:cysteine proteinase [Lentinula novae-zelandiae]|nr:cysteine proteinase [Lentinula novae-zelandiae]
MRPLVKKSNIQLLTSDPLQNTVQLNNQLRSLGLYAAPTIGDGNCLFRALSDQHYGSPSRHVEVRREICDFIEAHPERYEGFVDKGSGLSAYVAGMRQNATYGGHMELSAFAHLTKRNIKVVQPGLVYVIQCDPVQPKSPKPASKKAGDSPSKYTRSGSSRELDGDGDSPMSPGEGQDSTIYVAYHDWEHFSSVRNLRGPHTGIPQVCEMAPPPSAGSSSSASPPPEERLPPSKARKKERERKEKEKKEAGRLKAKEKATPHTANAATPISAGASPLSSLPPSPIEESDGFLDATTIPLPTSVSPSVATTPPVSHSPSPAPVSSSEQPTSDSEDASMGSPTVDLSATITLPKSNLSTTISHASSDSSDANNDDDDEDYLEPHVHSVVPPKMARNRHVGTMSERPLTRRQRKKLGLPKPRNIPVSGKGVGKIVIPGGKSTNSLSRDTSSTAEWTANGSGRVDVRGFRELKI